MTKIEDGGTLNNGLYHQISKLIDEWMPLHQGETFDLDIICRQLEITSRDGRTQASNKLNNLVRTKILEKNNRIYRPINNNIKYIDWVTSKEDYFKITFPSNHHPDDETYFQFADAVRISPGSVIVIAGVGNAGKSCFCRNILWDNMHSIHSVYFSSETTGAAFKRYADTMKWSSPFNGDGKPVFELVERYRDYQDVIQPDSLNIIDWLNIESGEFYRIGIEMQKIKEKIHNGLVVIAIQKDPGKDLGRGGTFSKELASLYLNLDYDKEHNLNRLTIDKSKEWVGNHDPNNKIYGFEITDYGTQVANIRDIKKCDGCYGSGKSGKSVCLKCDGVGWINGFRSHKNQQPELMEASDDSDKLPF